MSEIEKSYKFWDRVAGWSKAESAANSILVKYINSQFGTHILPDNTVLDYGCGTGTITLRIARNAAKVYGVDVSERMLKHAQQNFRIQNIENTTFLKITALDEMFQDDFFDVITTFNVFQYIKNRKELFNRFYRLLKPQGLLIIAVPCFGDTNSLSVSFVNFLRLVRIMPETYFFTEDEIEREITDTGLTIVESINLSDLPEKYIVAKRDL